MHMRGTVLAFWFTMGCQGYSDTLACWWRSGPNLHSSEALHLLLQPTHSSLSHIHTHFSTSLCLSVNTPAHTHTHTRSAASLPAKHTSSPSQRYHYIPIPPICSLCVACSLARVNLKYASFTTDTSLNGQLWSAGCVWAIWPDGMCLFKTFPKHTPSISGHEEKHILLYCSYNATEFLSLGC